MSQKLEVDSSDIVKVILQFCRENELTQSYFAIQDECQVSEFEFPHDHIQPRLIVSVI